MTRKEIYKKIAWMAKDLPEDEYEVWNGTGEKAKASIHKVNHLNRLKSIWNATKSIDSLNDYFLKYGLELKNTPNAR